MAKKLTKFILALLISFFLSPKVTLAQSPTLAFEYLSKSLNYAADSVVSGNLAYVAAGRDLYILDISDPRSPTQVGAYHVDDCDFIAVDVSGGLSFVAQALFSCSPRNSLFVLDVSNPENPRKTGEEIPTGGSPGGAIELDFEGGFVYLTYAHGGLKIIEVSPSGVPSEPISYAPVGVDFQDIKVVGNLVYLTDASRRIWVVDFSNKTSPTVLDTLEFPNHATGISISGNYAYVSIGAYLPAGNGGLRIVDISDPSNIFEVGEVPMPDPQTTKDVEVAGNYAFVVDDHGKLVAFDISIPILPQFITSYQMEDEWKLTVSGDLVFASNGPAGLTILRFTGLSTGGTQLNVPYLNQTDQPWGSEVYDSADTLNLDCEIYGGPYIKSCGCALTSAAMLLKYYKIDRGINSDLSQFSTTPGTLNRWLKDPQNKGYIFGNVDWFAIAKYSKKAHDVFGSQEIDYVLPNLAEDFVVLDQELQNERPVIVKVPGHFVVVTGKRGLTYTINDPRWLARTTLRSYASHFQEMRRFIRANTNLSGLLVALKGSTKFLVVDPLGRRAGTDPVTGDTIDDIPNAGYHLETPLVDDSFEDAELPPEENSVFMFEAADPLSGHYGIETPEGSGYELSVRSYDSNGELQEQIFLQRVGGQKYFLEYSPESGLEVKVFQKIKIDVKPRNAKNVIFSTVQGILPIEILTTANFDAGGVDVSTVKAGLGQAISLLKKGIKVDVDKDGDKDLLLFFRIKDIGLKKTDTELCLQGLTLDAAPFMGCDSIKIDERGKLDININEILKYITSF